MFPTFILLNFNRRNFYSKGTRDTQKRFGITQR